MSEPWAVIGAGPAGLAAVRNLLLAGLDVVGFEIGDDVGGLWDIDNPTSTMYESAHLISSKRTTEYAAFPFADEVADYPHHAELAVYFRDYARAFGLRERYEFGTEVTRVEPRGPGRADGWHVTTVADGEERTRDVAGVLIANGTLHHPNVPTLPGAFAGEVIHSSAYRYPSTFRDRRVLVVGCGNSGADLTVDAVHQADAVHLSVRRGYHFVPKYAFGRPIDTIGGLVRLPASLKQRIDGALLRLVIGSPTDYGLPEPDHRLYESHPVLNSLLLHHLGHGDVTPHGDVVDADGTRVDFADGTSADVDLIVLATGYRLHYPFIDPAHLRWTGYAPRLYLNTFTPDRDDLFVLGMVEAAGLGWEGRNEQAALVAAYVRGLRDGHPGAAALQQRIATEADTRLTGGYRYLELERMAYYVAKDAFRGRVTDHVEALGGMPG